MHRCPLGARPWLRVILVDAHVSSINTSLSTSSLGRSSLHLRRAACTSSRSCSLACRVFFEGQIPSIQLVPQSADLGRNALSSQPFLHLGQGKTGLGGNPATYDQFHLRQAGTAMTADLKAGATTRFPLPIPNVIHVNAADLIAPCNRRRTLPPTQRPQYPIPQILRIGLHLTSPSTNRKIIAQTVST